MTKVKVSKVIDGDTFVTQRGRKIRLANVNAPELNNVGGKKAKGILNDLIGGETITYDSVGKSYDRTVAKVQVRGKSVNNFMRGKGYK